MSNVWTVALASPCRGASTSLVGLTLFINAFPKANLAGDVQSTRNLCTASWGLNHPQPDRRRQEAYWERRYPASNTICRYFSLSRFLHSPKPKPISKATLRRTNIGRRISKPAEETPERKGRDWMAEIQKGQVFGHQLPAEKGYGVLREIQKRRTSGSLADKGISNLGCSEQQAKKALEWLRENYPLDEEAIAVGWAEAEAARLETLYNRQAQKIGLFKKEEEYVEPTPGVHGVVDDGSVLVQRQKFIAAKKKAMEEEEKAKKKEERNQGISNPEEPKYVMPWNNAALKEQNKERRDRWARLAKAAELSTEDIFAKRSALSRLWAPTLFGATLIFLAVVLSTMYVPPRREARLFPDTPPAISTCLLLAAINAVAFVFWRRPSAWYTMNRYMMLSAGHPNAVSVLGNIFSHQQVWHFAQNMLFLFLVGPHVHEDVGRGNFLALYLASGLFGSLFNLYVNVLTRNFTMASVGASGSLLGLLGAYFMLEDRHQMRIPFTDVKFEFSSKVGLAAWLVLEVAAFVQQRSRADHLSHLGGMFAGCVGGWWLRQRRQGGGVKEEERAEDGAETVGDADTTALTGPMVSEQR